MTYHSPLTSIILGFFRASLLFVALLSTFYAHFSLFSELVASCFLFLNIVFVCKKMSSYEYERLMVQPNKLPEQEATTTKRSQNGESLSEPDLIFLEDQKFEMGAKSLECDSVFNLCEELGLEEDYLIEIPLLENEGYNLEAEMLSDMDDISGDDNLIEIDISLGSVSHREIAT